MITVKKGVSATITLKGVSIETANANTAKMSCIELEEGADVTLVLSGMNNLYTVSNSWRGDPCAGRKQPDDAGRI